MNTTDSKDSTTTTSERMPHKGLIIAMGAATGELAFFTVIIAKAKAAGAVLGTAVASIGAGPLVLAAGAGVLIAAGVVYGLPPGAAKPVAKAAAVIGGAAAGVAVGMAVGGPIGAVIGGVVGGLIGWFAS